MMAHEKKRNYGAIFLKCGDSKNKKHVRTGMTLWSRPRYGRARIGERVASRVAKAPGQNVTLIAAINPQFGLIHHFEELLRIKIFCGQWKRAISSHLTPLWALWMEVCSASSFWSWFKSSRLSVPLKCFLCVTTLQPIDKAYSWMLCTPEVMHFWGGTPLPLFLFWFHIQASLFQVKRVQVGKWFRQNFLKKCESPQVMMNAFLRAFLPPYSPFLNPIEEAFGVVKANAKRQIQRRRQEVDAIDALPRGRRGVTRALIVRSVLNESVQEMTSSRIVSWYLHSLTYHVRSHFCENIDFWTTSSHALCLSFGLPPWIKEKKKKKKMTWNFYGFSWFFDLFLEYLRHLNHVNERKPNKPLPWASYPIGKSTALLRALHNTLYNLWKKISAPAGCGCTSE